MKEKRREREMGGRGEICSWDGVPGKWVGKGKGSALGDLVVFGS